MPICSRYFAIGVGYPNSYVFLHNEALVPYLFINEKQAKNFIVSDEMHKVCNERGYGQDEMHVIQVEVWSSGKTVL